MRRALKFAAAALALAATAAAQPAGSWIQAYCCMMPWGWWGPWGAPWGGWGPLWLFWGLAWLVAVAAVIVFFVWLLIRLLRMGGH